MLKAAGKAADSGKPWVLDPVGAGASRLRQEVSRELSLLHPSVIRGNASEIMTLSGQQAPSRGVDSGLESTDAQQCAVSLASRCGCVVSMSGAVDCITDGLRQEQIFAGSPLMSRVTAMGCAASALTGAFIAVVPDPFRAACSAMRLCAEAGEKAAAQSCGLTGTMAVKFIDNLCGYEE